MRRPQTRNPTPPADLEALATSLGYETWQALLHELYVVQGMGIAELSARTGVPDLRIQRHVRKLGYVRKRGGSNNEKVVITPELIAECMRDGVNTVAQRLGIDGPAFASRLRKLHAEGKLPEVQK
jgi:hypothetical protein